jgi:hypothetical protein
MVPKESRKISNQFRERVKMEREREWTHAKIFEVEMFFSSKDIHSFILRDFQSSFLSLFFQYFFFFSLFFSSSVSLFCDFENI